MLTVAEAGRKGGKARLKKMTPEERERIARRGKGPQRKTNSAAAQGVGPPRRPGEMGESKEEKPTDLTSFGASVNSTVGTCASSSLGANEESDYARKGFRTRTLP